MIPDGGAGHSRVEQPILWLGMASFPAAQRVGLEALLTRSEASPHWHPGPFGEADAWWVNGAKVRVLANGNLSVAPGLPTEHRLNLNLEDVDRPIAFAAPIPAGFEPRCAFDPDSKASVDAALLQFDTWLRLLRSQFVLGKQLIERKQDLGRNVFHLTRQSSLLAVVDLHDRKVALAPAAHPSDLWQAHWHRRPAGAHDTPCDFVSCTPSQVAWTYVRRTQRDMLPPHYRVEPVFYRRVPAVPVRWLHDSHLILLRELSAEPGTLESLAVRTGLTPKVLDMDLACLYYAGAVTTTRAKAALPSAMRGTAGPRTGEPEPNAPACHDRRQDLTAPASLEHKQARRDPDRTS